MAYTLDIGAALIIGLLGATHCIAMCGGITSALSMAIPEGKQRQKRLLTTLFFYNLGRVSSYSLAGLFIGAFGYLLGQQSSLGGLLLRSLAATLLVLMGLYIGNWWKGLVLIEKAGSGLWRLIQPWSKHVLPVRNLKQAFVLGLIWGWLPCGLVYSTLIWAGTANNAVNASILMLAFGLGTLPAIFTTGLLADRVALLIQNSRFRMFSGAILMIYGVWTFPFIQRSFI